MNTIHVLVRQKQLGARFRWLGLAVLLTGSFVVALDLFIVNVALPSIRRDLGAGYADMQFVIAGYTLSYAVLLVTGGRLGDIYGRKRMFLAGMAGFTTASALCGLAPDTATLIGARVVQGAAAAMLFPQVFASIRVQFDEAERRRAFGILGAVLGLSALVGQGVGGWLVESDIGGVGWRAIFLVNLPVGAAAVTCGIPLLTESRAAAATRLDLPGVLLGACGLVLVLVPLIEGRQAGWPTWAIASLILAAPVLLGFVAWERRLEERGGVPVLAMHLFADRGFVIGIALVLVLYATINAFVLALSVVLQFGLNFAPFAAGLVLMPAAGAFSVTSLLTARLVARFGQTVLRAGALLYASGAVAAGVQVALAGGAMGVTSLMPACALLCIGQALMQTPLLNAVLGAVAERDAGMAAGAVSTMQQTGAALGVALIGMVLFAAGGAGGGSFLVRFVFAMACVTAGAIATYGLLRMLAASGARA